MDSIQAKIYPDKSTRWARTFLFLLILQASVVSSKRCKSDCVWDQGLMNDLLATDQKWEYCHILRSLMDCLNINVRGCHKNILEHNTLRTGYRLVFVNNECKEELRKPKPVRVIEEQVEPTTDPPPVEPLDCSYQGTNADPPSMRHCGLFGDPHLKTFHGHFQTCRVQGAWPLIDSKYFAVTVTNEPVRPGSSATVTSKITVIVKGHVSQCTMREKVYEAHVDSLPLTFTDNSITSGEETQHSTHLEVIKPNEHVLIRVQHLAALFSVRRQAGALSFAAQLPHELAMPEEHEKGTLPLCLSGCPIQEQLASLNDVTQNLAMYRHSALQYCEGHNLSSTFLEWCIFDVMNTGDLNFAVAAKAAQDDVVLMDPMAEAVLGGVAKWPYSSAPPRTAVWPVIVTLLVILAACR